MERQLTTPEKYRVMLEAEARLSGEDNAERSQVNKILEAVLTPVLAGTAELASGITQIAADAADLLSFGAFPKEASDKMREWAAEDAKVGEEFAAMKHSQTATGKAVRTAYDLLPLGIGGFGLGGVAFQTTVAAGEAGAAGESVPNAVVSELAEAAIRPVKALGKVPKLGPHTKMLLDKIAPKLDAFIGDLTGSSTVQETLSQ